jgi:hypothetical protein
MNSYLKIIVLIQAIFAVFSLHAQHSVPEKPRILISTDIGGTDPDDNQSLVHLLMYSDRFHIEGLVSSPSYGKGSVKEILRMIDLYEKDLPKLRMHQKGFATPQFLRSISKQGRSGRAPYIGYSESTEGSNWIITCAKKKSKTPLWVLVWGGLDDVAQALHDAPEIEKDIRVYWIGGPNKKWGATSYAYVAQNFPNLHFIEVNSTYYGFFSNKKQLDEINPTDYYTRNIQGAGFLGRDFKNYYRGEIKMGDTPSLLYMMDGDPSRPDRSSWGGSFSPISYSPRVIYSRPTTLRDSVAFCTLIEFHLKGPISKATPDSVCFWMETPYKETTQKWPGYYLGHGEYALKYVPKQAEIVDYSFRSMIPELNFSNGQLVVTNTWPGKRNTTDYPLGPNWFTDRSEPSLYDGKIQGGKTISRWRDDVLIDWAKRWKWLLP